MLRVAIVICLSLFMILSGRQSFAGPHVWIEAEDFVEKSDDFMRVESAFLGGSQRERTDGAFFLQRSGWNAGESLRSSNDAYMEVDQNPPPGSDALRFYVTYAFEAPADAKYYLWLRCDAPPRCYRKLSAHFDVQPGETPLVPLLFKHWGLWSWWPWGEATNAGKAREIFLKKGKHRLVIEMEGRGFRLDRILITQDPDYVPFGVNTNYYNSCFEPLEIIGAHNDSGLAEYNTAIATGWAPSSDGLWSIERRGTTDDHYYFLRPRDASDDASSQSLAYSLIDGLSGRIFSAGYEVLYDMCGPRSWDSLFLYNFKDADNYGAVRITRTGVEAMEKHDGKSVVISRSKRVASPAGRCFVEVRRTRTDLNVAVDSVPVLSVRSPLGGEGRFGVGSETWEIGFDNVVVLPSDKVDWRFDFGEQDDPAFSDWKCIRGKQVFALSSLSEIKKGDLVCYDTPAWSDSRLSFTLSSRWKGAFSLLFPYAGNDRFVETRVERGSGGSVELVRHLDGKNESMGRFSIDQDMPVPDKISIESVRGLITVYFGERKILESNEYDILAGSLAFDLHGVDRLPVREVQATKRMCVVDTFPFTNGDALLSGWKIQDGTWSVRKAMAEDQDPLSGQMVAEGPGLVVIGDPNWQDYAVGLSAYFDRGTSFTVATRLCREGSLEFACSEKSLGLMRQVENGFLGVGTVSLDQPLSGWHRVGIRLEGESISCELDGQERLRVSAPQTKGLVGIRNKGEYALFDDFSVNILSYEEEGARVRKVDPVVVDIEHAILE